MSFSVTVGFQVPAKRHKRCDVVENWLGAMPKCLLSSKGWISDKDDRLEVLLSLQTFVRRLKPYEAKILAQMTSVREGSEMRNNKRRVLVLSYKAETRLKDVAICLYTSCVIEKTHRQIENDGILLKIALGK